jgi:hypothetical protein
VEARWESIPDPFGVVEAEIAAMRWRPELAVETLPAPVKLAPFAAAVGAEVELAGQELGNGRLVVLHDPAGQEAWGGDFRCVGYAHADTDHELVADPCLADVGWDWLLDALAQERAAYANPSGTVTAISSKSFGSMKDDPQRCEVELRASWTPLLDRGRGITAHLRAWSQLLCQIAGLPPTADGVIALHTRRVRRR